MADEIQKPVEAAPKAQPAAVEPVAPTETVAAPAPVEVETPAPVVAEKPAAVAAEKIVVAPAPVAAATPKKKDVSTPAVKSTAAVPAPAAPAKAKAPAKPAPAARKAAPVKAPAPAREVKPAPVRSAKIAARTASAAKVSAKSKPAPRKTFTAPKISAAQPVLASLKEKTMAKTVSTDFLAQFQSFFSDFQTKAKDAYEKGTSAFGDANDFAKGNVEAIVESGKILASGLQELSTSLVTESRSAFETLTTEVKELAAVKSPTDFLSLQTTLARKHFDAAVAQASKNTEAVLKLANEVVTPLSSRVTLAVEKVSKAA